MKKTKIIVTILLCCCVAVCGFSQTASIRKKNIVTIKGRIDGIKSGKLLLVARVGERKLDTLGSSNFNSSTFLLRAIVKEPMVTQLLVEGYQGGFLLMAEPTVTYSADLKKDKGEIKGGNLQDEYHKHLEVSNSIKNNVVRLHKNYTDLRGQNKFRSASRTNDTLRMQEALYKKTTDDFLAKHDDLITAYTYQVNAEMKKMGWQESQKLYDKLGANAKKTLSARILKERIERLKKTAEGVVAPDFTLDDINGKKVTMSKVSAKIKILDFWASWCGPCRLNNPILKSLYKDYHSKGLEIIGISLDTKKENWISAVKKDALDWIQVSPLTGWKGELIGMYNITGVPTLIVLDEQNRIIARGLKGNALREFIKKKL
ncbi:MAG: AhpC/TSA family protein [Flavobacteriaceae bacterium]|nr:AhpC/TSA family protein [Flavobacteriaceae bacterium]